MTDLSKCPECGGEADNGHDRCMPPNVYLCSKCQDTPTEKVATAKVEAIVEEAKILAIFPTDQPTDVRESWLRKVLTQTIEECEARHREEMREAVRAGIDYGGACIDRIQGRMTKAEWRYAADRLLEYSPDDEITSEVSE